MGVLLSSGAFTTPAVEAAFRAVLRHLFVPEVSVDCAYRNEAIPTKLVDGRAVSSGSQPSIVAAETPHRIGVLSGDGQAHLLKPEAPS